MKDIGKRLHLSYPITTKRTGGEMKVANHTENKALLIKSCLHQKGII